MATEDVLKRADKALFARNPNPGQDGRCFCWDCALIRDLSAEVIALRAENADLRDQVQTMLAGRMSSSASEAEIRELRRDRERLESALGRGWINVHTYDGNGGWIEETIETREDLDAAIGPIDLPPAEESEG